MPPRPLKTNRGFTLTEIAIVLGIVGIVTASIWVTADSVQKNAAVTQLSEDTITTIQNLRTLANGGASALSMTTGDITTAMINAGVFPPATLNTTKTNAYNPWGQDYKLYGWTSGRYVFSTVVPTQDSCMKYVMNLKTMPRTDLAFSPTGGATPLSSTINPSYLSTNANSPCATTKTAPYTVYFAFYSLLTSNDE